MNKDEKGRFKKGNTLSKGRPKGTKNKNTAQIREFYANLITDHQEQFISDLKTLKPYERVRCLIELSKYVLPTLKSIEFGNTLEELSDEDLQKIINELKNQ